MRLVRQQPARGELNYVNYWSALTPTVAKSLTEWWGRILVLFSSERVLALLRRDGLYPGPICTEGRHRGTFGPPLLTFSLLRRGRERLAGEVSDALAEAVNNLFHHTLLSDAEIASRIISDYHLQTSARQVKSIRLLSSWLRRSSGTARVA